MRRLLFIISFLTFLPAITHGAAELSVDAPTAMGVGQTLTVRVVLRIDEPVNAVEGVLRYNPALLDPGVFSDAGSVISLWLERPHVETPGTIIFSGIMPGGATSAGVAEVILFTFPVRALSNGTSRIEPADVQLFLHGEAARTAPVTLKPTTVMIDFTSTPAPTSSPAVDTTPPEAFVIEIVRDSWLSENRWTAVFQTVDKGTAIARYEARERFLGITGSWREVINPFPLSDQTRVSILEVRAIDGADNVRTERLIPVRLKVLWAFAGALAVLILNRVFRRSRIKGRTKGQSP